MEISELFRTIRARLQYSYDNNVEFPSINIIEKDRIIPMKLWTQYYSGIDYVLLPLSSIWNTLSYDNRIKVSDFLCGIRQRQDFITLMRWMNERKNISNEVLNIEMDTN